MKYYITKPSATGRKELTPVIRRASRRGLLWANYTGAGLTMGILCSYRRIRSCCALHLCRTELSAIYPHSMQQDGQLSGHRDNDAAVSFGSHQSHAPRFDLRACHRAHQQCIRSLPVTRKGQSGKVLLCPQQDYPATSVANFCTAVLTIGAVTATSASWKVMARA